MATSILFTCFLAIRRHLVNMKCILNEFSYTGKLKLYLLEEIKTMPNFRASFVSQSTLKKLWALKPHHLEYMYPAEFLRW